MNRSVLAIALALLTGGHATAQFQWDGPFTGTVNWSAGVWSPSTPPTGGGAGASLTFTQIAAGAYIAANDLGNPFVLTTLNLASAGGGITVNSLASNTLEFVGSAGVNQNGIGVAVINSTAELTAANTTIGGANFGNVRWAGVLSGSGGITIDRPQDQYFTGLVDIAAANVFGGGVTLQSGNLRVGNATALGTGVLTVNGGTLGATVASTIANDMTLNQDLVYSGFANLTTTGVISESGGARNVVVSAMTGATLILQGTNTYTGATIAEVNPRMSSNGPVAGSVTFSGPAGSAALSSGFSFDGGGTLTLDNAAVGANNNNNRIGDSAPVAISGGTLVVNGANAGATREDIGVLSGRGSIFVTMNAGTAGNTGTTLQADSLVRTSRGQFLFRGNNASFGAPVGANVANLIFDTAPALVGGGGAAGTTTISTIPYAIGGISTTSTGTDLVTYGPNGVRPLSATAGEYAATITSGATTADNVRLAAAQAITAPTQINALVIATTTPFTGSNSTLTVNSGTVLNTSAAPIPAEMTLAFGANEGVLFNNAILTVNGVLTGTNGLTKTGTSNLVLNNTANNVTGTLTLNQAAVSFADPAVVASFTDVLVNGRASTSTPGLIFSPTTGDATLNKPMTVTDGFARLQSGGAGSTLTYAGQISGDGGVLVNGGQVELTNTSNNYTGQTRVFAGRLLVSSDSVLGASGGVDIGSLATGGLRLTGDWTTSRDVSFSFTSQIDTNGFDWTINTPVTTSGAAITLEKVGAGAWIFNAGGAMGQNLTSGTVATTTTLNINGGEIRALNPTGSATGTANININGTSIVSGTGNFGGPTTIAPTAFLQPGTGGSTIGTLSFGSNVTLNGTFAVNAAGTIADSVNIAGALTLGAASVLEFNLSNTYDPNATYTLMQFASLTGTFAATPGQPSSHFLVYNPTTIQLVPVPEPTALLAVAGMSLAVGHFVRRRKGRFAESEPSACS